MIDCVREAARKVPPLMARPLREGGGVEAGPLREKKYFFWRLIKRRVVRPQWPGR